MLTSEALHSTSIQRCAELYRETGVTVWGVPALSARECDRISNVLSCLDMEKFHRRTSVGPDEQKVDYTILDTYQTFNLFPSLCGVYVDGPEIISEIADQEVILSPHALSAMNLCVYRQNETIGKHVDTNPVSALLFLSEGAPLMIETFYGIVELSPVVGHMAVFQGRLCAHWVPPVDREQFRVTAPMNYYLPHDTHRPDYIDRISYYNMSYEDATR